MFLHCFLSVVVKCERLTCSVKLQSSKFQCTVHKPTKSPALCLRDTCNLTLAPHIVNAREGNKIKKGGEGREGKERRKWQEREREREEKRREREGLLLPPVV